MTGQAAPQARPSPGRWRLPCRSAFYPSSGSDLLGGHSHHDAKEKSLIHSFIPSLIPASQIAGAWSLRIIETHSRISGPQRGEWDSVLGGDRVSVSPDGKTSRDDAAQQCGPG